MGFIKKWYTYQKERFPVATYGMYIFSIVFGTFCFAIDKTYNPNWIMLLPMFAVAFLQFLMVRIVDEFKDYEEDAKYRPYRPVPRGLVTLKELGILGGICAAVQVGITAILNLKGLIFLGLVWLFFEVMSKSFFIKKLVDKHILLEVTLDELLMPVLVLYLSTFVTSISVKLIPFLILSYLGSWIVEIARKVRCKEDEEEGVKTYTAVFGIPAATMIVVILEALIMIMQSIILGTKYIIPVIALYVLINIPNILFIIKQNKKLAKTVGLLANIYLIIAYISMVCLVIG